MLQEGLSCCIHLKLSIRSFYRSTASSEHHTALCELTQLFFGPQRVEAGLRDDLTEQLQQHVVVGGLHVCLVVDLNATVVVHLVPLLVNVPAT